MGVEAGEGPEMSLAMGREGLHTLLHTSTFWLSYQLILHSASPKKGLPISSAAGRRRNTSWIEVY